MDKNKEIYNKCITYEQTNNVMPINEKYIPEEFLKLTCRCILYQHLAIHKRREEY